MLIWHEYCSSKKCIRTIWMCHEASSDSGKTKNSMQFWPIQLQEVLNRHAGFDPMQWLGLQAYLTLTVTCTLRNCVFLTRAFITICTSCTCGIGCWRKSDIICLWFVTNFRRELASHWLSRWAETGLANLSLWAVLIEIGSHNLCEDAGYWWPKHTS